jgi:hypothetical protein
MRRLFTFGCSFTQYWRWPTWADALGQEADYFENWGVCGSGNSLIFYSLIECHQRNQLGPDDDVYIMWTNTSREDRYVGNRWLEGGNVYWSAGSTLPAEYVRQFACERGYLIRDLTTIAAVTQLIEHWGCQYQYLSMVPLTDTNESMGLASNPADQIGTDADVRVLYQSTLEQIKPSMYETVFGSEWFSGSGIPDSYDASRRDFHPTPTEHVQYLDLVMPGAITQESTRDWMRNWELQVRTQSLTWMEPNRPVRL